MTNFKIIDGNTTIDFDTIGDLSGFEFPTVTTIVADVPGRSGALYINSKYSRRRLSWQGVILEPGPSNRRDILRINVGSLKTLKFETCDGLALQAQIEIERITMPYRLGRSQYLIEAVAPDPRFYTQTLTSVSTGETTSVGGVTLPTTLPIDFSNVVGTPKLQLENNGTEETPAVFTIHGPGTTFTIQNVTTGEVLQLNTTLSVSDTVVIDILNRTALLNGTTNIFGLISGDWWLVPLGESELHFTAQTGSGETTQVTVAYREAYKGI